MKIFRSDFRRQVTRPGTNIVDQVDFDPVVDLLIPQDTVDETFLLSFHSLSRVPHVSDAIGSAVVKRPAVGDEDGATGVRSSNNVVLCSVVKNDGSTTVGISHYTGTSVSPRDEALIVQAMREAFAAATVQA